MYWTSASTAKLLLYGVVRGATPSKMMGRVRGSFREEGPNEAATHIRQSDRLQRPADDPADGPCLAKAEQEVVVDLRSSRAEAQGEQAIPSIADRACRCEEVPSRPDAHLMALELLYQRRDRARLAE